MKLFIDPHVADFLRGLDMEDRELSHEFIELFKQHGFALFPPAMKKLSGHSLWELRPGGIRLLLGKLKGGSVIVLGFYKDNQKTRKRHITTALKRLKLWQNVN